MGRFRKGLSLTYALAALALAGPVAAGTAPGGEVGWGPGDPAAKTSLIVELVENGQETDAAYGGASRKYPWELVLLRKSLSAADDSVVGARKVRVLARSLKAPDAETGLVALAVDLADAKAPSVEQLDGPSRVPAYAHREIRKVLSLEPGVPRLVSLDEGAPAGTPARALRVEIPRAQMAGGTAAVSR